MKVHASILARTAASFFCLVASSFGCGINWNVPTNHFDGINEFGELSYWRKIGLVDFGADLKIPLIIGFRPARAASSLLGRGWIVPILESNIVQIDDRRFLLTQPDGIARQFWRKVTNDPILQGQGNWKGKIEGNKITLWADCGWRLAFNKGKIASITTPKNRIINIIYSGERASEIQEEGRTVLRVEINPATGATEGLSFGSSRVGVEMGDKPRVERIQGANMVGEIEQSLHKLTFSDGTEDVYHFGVDEKLLPTLEISGDMKRSFTWNPSNGALLQDGQWTYKIKPPERYNAEITRVNESKKSELWFYDKAKGEETVQNIDGTATVSSWFITGVAAGKARKIEGRLNGKTLYTCTSSYDETGALVRYADSRNPEFEKITEALNRRVDKAAPSFRMPFDFKGVGGGGRFVCTNRIRDLYEIQEFLPNNILIRHYVGKQGQVGVIYTKDHQVIYRDIDKI